MRRLSFLALAFLVAAPPAFAQKSLAQRCAAFGEAQYRKLDPSLARMAALDFPAPVLERLATSAGSQAVASVLTLRGRLTYRKRPTVETPLVCLLDATDRPVFLYALPAPTVRSAPTPLVRGPGATLPQPAPVASPQPAPRAAEQPRPALPPGSIRLRGLLRDTGGRLQFTPCDGAPLPLEDRTPGQELGRALRELTAGQEGRPMFVEFFGGRDSGPAAGVSALEVRRAAVETAGCRERFDQREWIGTGNEPSWRLEVTGRDMLLNVPGGAPPRRAGHGGLLRQGGSIAYAASEGTEFDAVIYERRCVDSMSGSLFAYSVEVRSEGRTYAGCAAHNPAMPAP